MTDHKPEFPTETDVLDAEDAAGLACVLSFNANDPSGAGGLSCDATAMASVGAHCMPVCTGAYVRDTSSITDFYPLDEEAVHDQARAVAEDVPVQVIKVGFVGTPESLAVIAELSDDYDGVPVVAYMPNLSWWEDDKIANCCCRKPACWSATTAPCAAGCCPNGRASATPGRATSPKLPLSWACPTPW